METLITARRITVAEPSQVAEARRWGVAFAEQLGFGEAKASQVAIAITEAGTNLLKHAHGGEILLCPVTRDEQTTLYMLAVDKGPGMSNVTECMIDGFSTVGSMGTGLGAISRLADGFDIYSIKGGGTVLSACFGQPQRPVGSKFEFGGLSIPVAGEELCGDAWAVVGGENGPRILLSDGLGHGMQAHDASQEAIAVFRENPYTPLTELLDLMHLGMRSTRGAALAVAELDLAQSIVRFCGIGNIAGVILNNGKSQHFVSMNGIVGHQVRSAREFTYSLPPGSLVIMHSDGLGSRWDLKPYPGLTMKPPMLIAGVLYRDFARGRDDVTVVAARVKE